MFYYLKLAIKKFVFLILELGAPSLFPIKNIEIETFTHRFAALEASDEKITTPSARTWNIYINQIQKMGAAGTLPKFMRWPVIQQTMYIALKP